MWTPLLLLGAGVGAFLLYKKLTDEDGSAEGTPPGTPVPPEPPPGVINLSWEGAKSFYDVPPDGDLVFVSVVANSEQPERGYRDTRQFSSLDDALENVESITRFFDQNKTFWTCPGGSIVVTAYGWQSNQPVHQKRTWDSCPENLPMSKSARPRPPQEGQSPTKPVYVVDYAVTGTNELGQSFFFRTDAEAELYYRLLHSFFAQPIIHKAYTNPLGQVFVSKYGTPPAATRGAMWDQDGPVNLPFDSF